MACSRFTLSRVLHLVPEDGATPLSSPKFSRGRTGEGLIRIYLFILLASLLANACAKQKITFVKPSLPREKGGVYHVVERHQTLYRICKTYQVDLKEVASLNGIKDQTRIRSGQRIFIPGVKKVLKVEIYIDDVVAEETGGEKEKYVETPDSKRIDLIWPLNGKRGDLFEDAERRLHQGMDILAPAGTPIKASQSGWVTYSGSAIRGYGNLIILRHNEEFVTVYAHNQVNLVEEGNWVEREQIIAKVGQTGNASGPHLHFEIRKNNKAVDPLFFLK